MRTPCSRSSCVGWMKVRATYWFLIRPISFGQAGLLRIAGGRGQGGVRHGDDHIGVDGDS